MIVNRIRRDDRGSSLIIALAFLMLFSLWLSATLSATTSGLNIAQTMRVQPKRLYAADAAIERTIHDMRYDDTRGRWDNTDCNRQFTLGSPPRDVYVECVPDGNSGRGEQGESSPPIGIIALSNGALNEFAYQQYGNDIVRIDGGVFSNTPVFFQPSNTLQLNLCPRNAKRIDGGLIRGTPTVTASSNPFTPNDTGVPISGNGIPPGSTISAYVAPNIVAMSNLATASGTRSLVFREDYPRLQRHCHVPTALEDPDNSIRSKGKMTAVPRVLGGESCDEAKIVSLWINCDGAYIPDPDGIDKNYPIERSSGFPNKTVPPCGPASDNRPVKLEWGRYNDAVALTTLTTTCNKLIWFQPGPYYFEFSNANPQWTIGASGLNNMVVVGGDKTWGVHDSTAPKGLGDRDPFVGYVTYDNKTNTSTVSVCPPTDQNCATPGPFRSLDACTSSCATTPTNGSYINAGYNLPYRTVLRGVSNQNRNATFAGQALSSSFNTGVFTLSPITQAVNSLGSLCDPRTNLSHPGVQFVFGGQSRVLLTDGKTEICSPGPLSASAQQIAIYGPKSGMSSVKEQNGCFVAQPYDASGSGGFPCAMIKAPEGSKPAFIVHGTIYAPKAVIDLSLQGVGYQVVSRGVIARVVALRISPSSLFNGPVIYSPNFDTLPGAPRKVTLTACLDGPCPDVVTGEGSGKPKIRSVVTFKDNDEFNNPGVPGYKVFIDSWSVL